MNDFTKEELMDLFCIVEEFSNTKDFSILTPKVALQLGHKIQSMIDNYCEHDWRKGVHLFNGIYCTKCKKHFEVNNE